MRKVYLILIYLLLSFSAVAKVSISVHPSAPVKGETFNIKLKIITNSREEPFISFEPSGFEVLGRGKEGVMIRTDIINGKIRTKRELVYSYSAVANRTGYVHLRDIKVDVGGEELTHPPVKIRVTSTRSAPRNIFLVAEVNKAEAYIGEGIDLRYYLYSRLPILETEIKAFPKLNGFIKRFHKINERDETVQYGGQIYRRSLKYSARIYPERTGKIIVDPMKLNLKFSTGRGGLFGGFFNNLRQRVVGSKNLEVKVLPIPSDNVPPHFTGLVGNHEFTIEVPKSKFLVNEAVEARLFVNGPGALENFDAPLLFDNDALEKFDTKSEVNEQGLQRARKVFDYTYLARYVREIPAKTIKLAVFDPESKDFITKEIELPELRISGAGNAGLSSGQGEQRRDSNNQTVTSTKLESGFVAPIFSQSSFWVRFSDSRFILIGLFIVILIQLGEFGVSVWMEKHQKGEAHKILRIIKKRGLTYSSLYQLLLLANKDKSETDLNKIVQGLDLSESEKKYLLESCKKLETKDFYNKGKKSRVAVKLKTLKKLSEIADYERV
jgi:hypothetical protein